MEKKKLGKIIFPFALGFVVALGGFVGESLIAKADSGYTTPIVLASNHNRVNIQNEKLGKAIRRLLGKEENAYLFSDDFLTNENFKPTVDASTGAVSAPTYQLDLSGTGITDILELCKFEFPETLKGINLASNGITNSDLENITKLASATASTPIVIGSDENAETITPACNFSQIIKKINLNDNNIDLSTSNISTYLNNNKLLFGIQNLGTIDDSKLVRNGDMTPMYYIRSDDGAKGIVGDQHYISLSISFEYAVKTPNSIAVDLTYNTPSYLLDFNQDNTGSDNKFGKVSISYTSIRDSSTAYFNGYSFTEEFVLFDIHFKDDFTVERLHTLKLNLKNGQLTESSPLVIEGFGKDSLKIVDYTDPNTNKITTHDYKNEVTIILNYTDPNSNKTVTKNVSVEFVVEDTIAPVIKLKGSAHVYWGRGKQYADPGVEAYDPLTENGETGEALTNIERTGNINHNQLGTYTLTYTVKDQAGNTASVERVVEIQERVLDKVDLRANTSNITSGDDIVLVVEPDGNIDRSSYETIEYKWYLDDVLYQTTKGDNVTGKSTTTIIPEKAGNINIRVEVKATLKDSDGVIEFTSSTLTLEVEPKLRNNSTLFLGVGIAVGVLLIIVLFVALQGVVKKRKITGKHKNFHKGKSKNDKKPSNPNQPEIQVIKNYNGQNGGTTSGGTGEGGGNSSFRLPENNSNDDKTL